MSASENDRLKRFDVVFRTILVVASIIISATIAFYKENLPPYSFFYSIIFFVGAISIWAYSTLCDGPREYVLKIIAWWTLMSAFTLHIARLIFSSFYLPPLVSAAAVAIAYTLTWPFFAYFRYGMPEEQEHYAKKVFAGSLLAIIVADVIHLIIMVISSFA